MSIFPPPPPPKKKGMESYQIVGQIPYHVAVFPRLSGGKGLVHVIVEWHLSMQSKLRK